MPRRQVLFESRREREFYRYYEPIRTLTGSGPPLCDLDDPQAALAHRPISSPDRSLTAFCQLGALRLGCRRAMLFFFDKNYAYILAEATRTLSLQDDAVHDIEDELWLGHSVIPRGYSVCEHTVNLPANAGTNRGDPSASTVHIINDLREDSRFCDRPFVLDGPKARFYAGVPITTPKGINIGAYCVVDDKVRSGLDEKGIAFLRDMASTTMTHLEMVRGRVEYMRGTRMVDSLSAFVEGTPDLQRGNVNGGILNRHTPSTVTNGSIPLPAQVQSLKSAAVASTEPTQYDYMSNNKPQTTSPRRFSGKAHGKVVMDAPNVASPAETPPTASTTSDFSHSASVSLRAEDLRKQLVASNVQDTFERAARLVQTAVEVDGAKFLDATVARYGGLVHNTDHRDSLDQSSDTTTSVADVTSTDEEGSMSSESPERIPESKLCSVLSSSSDPNGDGNVRADSDDRGTPLGMTEKFLRNLLRRYTRGKIWSFNEEGDASSDEGSSESGTSRMNGAYSARTSSDDPTKDVLARKRTRKREGLDDAKEIQRLFPGVRSLAIVGMWDHIRGKWFAACIVWSYSPLRLLSDGELHFLAAFNDVILAEVHRLEALNSDRAKVDFISSISHELRSPLHGILGSVECLQEIASTADISDLVSQIDICGRTLVDIVDHLLDYSKINFFSKDRTTRSHSVEAQQRALPAGRTFHLDGSSSLDASVLLDKITEDVVETAFYSFCCSKDKTAMLSRKVAFILDVDMSATSNWECRIATGGWKRICMNLVSNALKYTDDGYIKVSLSSAPTKRRKLLNVVLTVTDTGRGMSKEFVENHLFKAFSQENSFTEGTGLGMSLVAKIVKAFEGKIDVRSEKGIGTTIMVTVPLVRSAPSKADCAETEELADRQPFKGLAVGMLAVNLTSETPLGESLQIANLRKTCAELGLQTQDVTTADFGTVDFLLITERGARALQQAYIESDKTKATSGVLDSKPLVVVCDTFVSARQMAAAGIIGLTTGKIEFITQPAGPKQMTTTIHACLRDDSNSRHQRSDLVSGDSMIKGKPINDAKIAFRDWASLGRLPARPRMHQRTRSRSEPPLSPTTERRNPLAKGICEEPAQDQRHSELESQQSGPSSLEQMAIPTRSEGNAHAQAIQKPTAPEQDASAEKMRSGLPILIVDDNLINVQLLVTYAKKHNHRKATALDGLQAVEAYKAAYHASALSNQEITLVQGVQEHVLLEIPKVVLMDINMPVLDGFEATRQIRRFEQKYNLHPATIIALTGLGSAEAQQEAYSSGIDMFLMKPVRLKQLTSILEGIPRS